MHPINWEYLGNDAHMVGGGQKLHRVGDGGHTVWGSPPPTLVETQYHLILKKIYFFLAKYEKKNIFEESVKKNIVSDEKNITII